MASTARCATARSWPYQGLCRREFHDQLVERYTRHIDLVADAGYRNLICFSGNRNGMDPHDGMANAEVASSASSGMPRSAVWCW